MRVVRLALRLSNSKMAEMPKMPFVLSTDLVSLPANVQSAGICGVRARVELSTGARRGGGDRNSGYMRGYDDRYDRRGGGGGGRRSRSRYVL